MTHETPGASETSIAERGGKRAEEVKGIFVVGEGMHVVQNATGRVFTAWKTTLMDGKQIVTLTSSGVEPVWIPRGELELAVTLDASGELDADWCLSDEDLIVQKGYIQDLKDFDVNYDIDYDLMRKLLSPAEAQRIKEQSSRRTSAATQEPRYQTGSTTTTQTSLEKACSARVEALILKAIRACLSEPEGLRSASLDLVVAAAEGIFASRKEEKHRALDKIERALKVYLESKKVYLEAMRDSNPQSRAATAAAQQGTPILPPGFQVPVPPESQRVYPPECYRGGRGNYPVLPRGLQVPVPPIAQRTLPPGAYTGGISNIPRGLRPGGR